MYYTVQVKPKSKRESVKQIDSQSFIVKVNALPTDGQANKRLIELLANYFKVAKSNVIIVKGHKSKVKTVEVKR